MGSGLRLSCMFGVVGRDVGHGHGGVCGRVQVARHVSRQTVQSVELFRGTSGCFLDSVCTLLLTEVETEPRDGAVYCLCVCGGGTSLGARQPPMLRLSLDLHSLLDPVVAFTCPALSLSPCLPGVCPDHVPWRLPVQGGRRVPLALHRGLGRRRGGQDGRRHRGVCGE